eukprot:g3101.t1
MDWATQMAWSADTGPLGKKKGKGKESPGGKIFSKSEPRRHTASAQAYYRRMSVGRVLRDDHKAAAMMKKLKEEVEYQARGMTTHKYLDIASRTIAANKLANALRRKALVKASNLFNRWKYARTCDSCRRLTRDMTEQKEVFTTKVDELSAMVSETAAGAAARHHAELAQLQAEYQERTLRRFVLKMKGRVLLGGLRTWRDTVVFERKMQHLLARSLRAWSRNVSKDAFEHFRDNVQKRKHARAVAWRVLCRLKSMALAKGLGAWTLMVKELKRAEEAAAAFREKNARGFVVLNKAMGRIMRGATGKAFKSWSILTRYLRRQENLTKRATGMWVNRATGAALKTWIATVAETKRLRFITARAARKWANRALGGSFEAWYFHVEEKRRLRRTAEAVARRWTMLAVSGCFNAWQDQWASKKAARMAAQDKAARQAMGKWKNAELVFAFDRWKELHEQVRRLKGVAKRWMLIPLGQSFNEWVDTIKEAKRLRHATKKAMLRWKLRAAATSFLAWADMTAERRRLRHVANQVAARWRNREMSMMFQTWAAKTEEAFSLRHKAEIVARRMMNRVTSMSFGKWLEYVLEEQRLRRVFEKVALRWKAVAEALDHKRKARRIMLRWQNLALSATFEGWSFYVQEQHRLRHVAAKVAKRWQNLALAGSFSGWQNLVETNKRNRTILERCQAKWKNRAAAAAVAAWVSLVEFRVQARVLVNKFISRFLKATLSKGFRAWTSFALLHRLAAEEAERVALLVVNGQQDTAASRMMRVAKRMQNAVMARGWTRWVEHISLLRRMEKTFARWRLRDAAAALAKWVDMVETVKRYRLIVQRVGARWRNRAKSMAFGGWQASVAQSLDHKRKARKIMARWLRLALATTFDGWRGAVKEILDHRRKAKKIMLRWQNLALSGSYEAWLNLVETNKRNRTILERCQAKWKNRTAAAAMAAWSFMVSEKQRLRLIGQRITRKMLQRKKDAAFQGWRESVRLRVEHRLRIQRSVAQLAVSNVNSMKWRWPRPPPTLKLHSALAKVLVHAMAASQRRSFRMWHEWVLHEITAELQMERELRQEYRRRIDKRARSIALAKSGILGAALGIASGGGGGGGARDTAPQRLMLDPLPAGGSDPRDPTPRRDGELPSSRQPLPPIRTPRDDEEGEEEEGEVKGAGDEDIERRAANEAIAEAEAALQKAEAQGARVRTPAGTIGAGGAGAATGDEDDNPGVIQMDGDEGLSAVPRELDGEGRLYRRVNFPPPAGGDGARMATVDGGQLLQTGVEHMIEPEEWQALAELDHSLLPAEEQPS